MILQEHLQKIPYLLSLFLPIIIFFLFGLWLARMKYKGDYKRLKKAVEENDHLAADLTRALAPEKDMNQTLLGCIEAQKGQWTSAIKTAEDGLFTEQCRTRDLTNQLTALQQTQQQTNEQEIPDFSAEFAEKDQHIQTLLTEKANFERELEQLRLTHQQQLTETETTLARKDEAIVTLQSELETLRQSPPEEPQPVQPEPQPQPAEEPSAQEPQVSPAQVQASFELLSEEETSEDPTYGLIYPSRPSSVDDLKLIKGLGKVIEDKLNKIGIYRFKQIATWKPEHVKAFEKRLSFKNRITRDRWLVQAKKFHQEHHNEEI